MECRGVDKGNVMDSKVRHFKLLAFSDRHKKKGFHYSPS